MKPHPECADTDPEANAVCGEVNNILGFRCDRSVGHDGAHIQENSNGVNAWGFTLGEPSNG